MTTLDVASGGATYRGLADAGGARFLGIRYGEAPVGPLRFRAPRACRPSGLIDATRPGPAPPQQRRRAQPWSPQAAEIATGEDCLNLNLFTPGADGARRPVVVHVFGGGFQAGAASGYQDDAGFAAAGNVVLVRPNLRTGALGFLHIGAATGDAAPANRGLLDLVLALGWVRTHIADFGGDPDNVTLLGLSSGAFTIAALFGMEGVGHLFRRAWLMSGPASRIIAPDTAAAMARDFLRLADIGDRRALEALEVATILDVQDRIVATDLGERNAPGGRTLGIVLDGISLLRHPLAGLAAGGFAQTGLVVGWTRDEARLWFENGTMARATDRRRLDATVGRFDPALALPVLAELEAAEPSAGVAALEEAFLTRMIYRDPALRTAEAHARAGGAAWAYTFAWQNDGPYPALGAAHGFDEPFVFGQVDAARVPFAAGSPTAPALATLMSQALYAFTRSGRAPWPPYAEAGTIECFSAVTAAPSAGPAPPRPA